MVDHNIIRIGRRLQKWLFRHWSTPYMIVATNTWRNRISFAGYGLINMMHFLPILRRFSPATWVVRTTHGNFCVTIGTGELASYHELYIRDVYGLRQSTLGPTSLVIDIGANIGFFSVGAALQGAKVIAIEPNPIAAKLLRNNIERNGVTERVSVHELAISSFHGQAELAVPRSSTRGNITERNVGEIIDRYSVPLESLDGIVLAKYPDTTKVTLLKIDAEGSELQVIHGATNTLRMTGTVTLECHSDSVALEVFAILANLGFTPTSQPSKVSRWIQS